MNSRLLSRTAKKGLGRFEGLKTTTFTLVLGAQGVGKSSLTALFENAAVISPDAYVADYYAAVGIDPRDNPYDREIGDFGNESDAGNFDRSGSAEI